MSKRAIHIQAVEVKFFLDPNRVLTPDSDPTPEVARALQIVGGLDPNRVLTPDSDPTPEVARALQIVGGPVQYRVAFLDGPHLDFHTERWNVRFRDKGGKREVSFKRRLPIYHGSVAGVVQTALRQGFDAAELDEGYEAEIEWGPERRTLSLVKDTKLSDTPWPATADEAAALTAESMPGKLRKWLHDDWVASVLAVSRLFGPVPARRWKWEAIGGKTAFEVWDVRANAAGRVESIAEVSFKAETETEAASSRTALLDLLSAGDGWLLAESVLKTDLVLDRYH